VFYSLKKQVIKRRGVVQMGVYEAVKDALNMIQKSDNIELYRMLLDIQKESLELLEDNRVLKQRIRELENDKSLEDDLEVKSNCYFKKSTGDGPFCITCWDKDRKLVRMYLTDDYAYCHPCKYGTYIIR
jgi:hypothetical protein